MFNSTLHARYMKRWVHSCHKTSFTGTEVQFSVQSPSLLFPSGSNRTTVNLNDLSLTINLLRFNVASSTKSFLLISYITITHLNRLLLGFIVGVQEDFVHWDWGAIFWAVEDWFFAEAGSLAVTNLDFFIFNAWEWEGYILLELAFCKINYLEEIITFYDKNDQGVFERRIQILVGFKLKK